MNLFSKIKIKLNEIRNLVPAQLNNSHLTRLISEKISTINKDFFCIIEIGTGQGKGSTVSICEALNNLNKDFLMLTYEPDINMYKNATKFLAKDRRIKVVNEYFLLQEDIQNLIIPNIKDAKYLSVYNKYCHSENFLTPLNINKPFDIVFIDSVRYSHVAIIKNLIPYISDLSWIIMEDDIPGLGEKNILEHMYKLENLQVIEIKDHDWPFLLFQIFNSKLISQT